MRKFNFYVSGILYGKLKFNSDRTFFRKLDVFSGKLGEWEILTEQENQFYQSFLKMDFLSIAKETGLYEEQLKGTGEVSFDGQRYTSDDGRNYLQIGRAHV